MPLEKNKVIGAMFDVRPVDDTGRVDLSRISQIGPVLRLRKSSLENGFFIREWDGGATGKVAIRVAKKGVSRRADRDPKRVRFASDLERTINNEMEPIVTLASVGGIIHGNNVVSKPRLRPIQNLASMGEETPRELLEQERIINEISKPVSRDSALTNAKLMDLPQEPDAALANVSYGKIRKAEIDLWLENLQNSKTNISYAGSSRNRFASFRKIISWKNILIMAGIVVVIFFVAKHGLNLKNEILSEGNAAVKNLEDAKDKIASMDFAGASNSFAEAYEEFTKAGEGLNFMGASLGSLIADLPGAEKIKSANNLIEAGKLIADSGKAMSKAMEVISQTGLILNPTTQGGGSIGKMLGSLKDGLSISAANLRKAEVLLADVDPAALPEEKRDTFVSMKSELPLFNSLITDSVEYASFLEELVGLKGIKRYLLLFQNPAELRATGGFPGSYATVTFQDGSLKQFIVDDVYNLDGQLKENIIPPAQMQHITPTWGMRDANWFVDFPTSAKKVAWFYKKESGGLDVDGVITISPSIVSKILEIVGPVDMPEYNMKIDSKNFATAIQSEVEYGENRAQPKKILMDMAPRLLAKIYLSDKEEWLNIFDTFVLSMEKKDILMYFKGLGLQSFVFDKGFSGQIKKVDGDYLMVNFTNVKGSKTDAVTDTSIKLNTKLAEDASAHTLTITRAHNGGKSEFGFYNKQNPAYVRILVPEGSEIISITGNKLPDFKPLVNYSKAQFKRDDDLFALESSQYLDQEKGVTISKEAGKTVFAFWMIVDPQKTETINIEYSVPRKIGDKNYEILIQKQPGLKVDSFEFSLDRPEVAKVSGSQPALNKVGDKYILNGELENDLPIKVNFE